ncbi:unnamed protein product [Linum tenue]|uniref:DUF547 domain-containing protein n=1 Tax=Linum tenue TaxID=586396 RepID=A0AAV0GXM6_9ROSI|nr:unnamed protein product [Linum tenue]
MEQLQLLDDWKLSNPMKETRKSSLKQEILELQKQLEDQFLVRNALEKAAVGYWKTLPSHYHHRHHHVSHDDVFIPSPAKELIKEISALELEVVYLERYLVSLYKQRCCCSSEAESPESLKTKQVSQTRNNAEAGTKELPQAGNLLQFSSSSSSIRRCYSSLSHRFNTGAAISRALDSHHSLPLSLFEGGGGGGGDGMEISPNWVSEEMVKCISSIYCELAQPSSRLGAEGSSCSYQLREVGWMSIDVHKIQHVQHKIQHYRSLVSKLERVEPAEMKHGEKLAFWINVHNSLVMHSYLEYGIPRNHIRRTSLVLKAAYNVGGRTVSVDMIQTSILRCNLPRPAQQWLRVLLYPTRKLKNGDAKRPYSITTPEPCLYFALCTGNHSDPPLRVYGPETVFEDLEAAKQDYIQTSLTLHKQRNKVMLPKLVDCFAKESRLCPAALTETELDHLLPASVMNSIRRRMHNKPICWVPHNFNFRYLISRESMGDPVQPISF